MKKTVGVLVCIVLLVLASCGQQASPATEMALAPSETPLSPTDTPMPPTATPVPPTETPLPPTATAVPPSATPTPTPIPPTATATPTPEPFPGPDFAGIVVTFDGRTCTVSGTGELPAGEHQFVVNNLSDQRVALQLNRYLCGHTYQDMVELQGVQGQGISRGPAAEWVLFPEHSVVRDRSTGDFTYTYSLESVGEYGVTLWNHIAQSLTLCAPLQVTQGPSALPPTQAGDSVRCVSANGLERAYLLHIPAGWTSQEPVPVVFVFHGWGLSATLAQSDWGLDDVADVANFLAAYPVGVGWSWNDGGKIGYAATHNLNESEFVRQMLSDLSTVASIDPKRIYAMGYSQGGMLAYRLACEMSDIFAAIAPLAACMTYGRCQPQQAVSVIHVHGLADGHVPYSGGGPDNYPPVESGIAAWVEFSGCTGSAEVESLSDQVTRTAYASCEAGTAVELYTIESGEHRQPGFGFHRDLASTFWDFFAAHPKP
jgi:polyhydroxybutyrate depolymerase